MNQFRKYRKIVIQMLCLLLLAPALPADAKGSVDKLLKKARALTSQKKNAEAQVVYESILKTSPRNAEAHAGLAWSLFTQGKRDPAEEMAKKAEKLDPKNATAHNVLGAIYFSKGMVEEAKEQFRTVLQLDPNRRCGGCGDLRGFLGNDIRMPDKKKVKQQR